MSMRSLKVVTAREDIPPRRFVAWVKSGDPNGPRTVRVARAGIALGVTPQGSRAQRDCRIVVAGEAEVDFAGDVAKDQPVTCDVDGRAVAASPELPAERIAGYARVDARAGEYGAVFVGEPLRRAPFA